MVGIAPPKDRGENNPIRQAKFGTPDNLSQKEAVGEKGKMRAMLFECRNGEDDRGVPGKGGEGGGGQVGKVHGNWVRPVWTFRAIVPQVFPWTRLPGEFRRW